MLEGYVHGTIPPEKASQIYKKVKESINDGIEFIKEHPEMLGTGNPKVYGEGCRQIEKSVEKATDKVYNFMKDTFNFAKDHPEFLLASATPMISLFDD